jgi:hypothetical protein
VRITCDHPTAAVYIHLSSDPLYHPPGTMPPGTSGFMALDWKGGRLVGIEILDPIHHLHDDLLQAADTE